VAPGRSLQWEHDLAAERRGTTVIDLLTDFVSSSCGTPARPELGEAVQAILADLLSGAKPLDIFVVEGTVGAGSHGTGAWTCSPAAR